MAQGLFKKPENVTYTQMCIWIDNNFGKEDCDYNKAYEYMWLLSYMLAAKQKYFRNELDYEEFSSMLANEVFQRLLDKDKKPIKSVLNYMKSILFFRKCMYDATNRQKIIDPKYDDWDGLSYIEKSKNIYESNLHNEELYQGIVETLEACPSIIKKCIPKLYKADSVEYKNIYISCLLSMINKVTLPEYYNKKLEEKLDNNSNFDVAKFYTKYLDNDIILWHLPKSMYNVIIVILNKVNNLMVDEIKGLSNSIKVSEADFNSIMSSAFQTGGSNETDY